MLTLKLIDQTNAQEVLNIYKPFVEFTHVTFDYEVPTIDEFREKIVAITAFYPWVGAWHDGEMVAYAYASRFRPKKAYDWSAESTIYVKHESQGLGIGKKLYEKLFEYLRLQGIINVYAGVAIPNDQSIKFHEKMGFEYLGTYKKIGYKFNKWWDTRWYQLALSPHPPNPQKVRSIMEI